MRTRTRFDDLASCTASAITQPPQVERTRHSMKAMKPAAPASQRTRWVAASMKISAPIIANANGPDEFMVLNTRTP